MSFAFHLVTSTIKSLVRLLCRVDDAQLERVPKQGPLILVTNHINFLEVPLLFTHLQPRPLAGFAKAETWANPALHLLFDLWGAIPLHRGEADITALRQGLEALKAGRILGVAPEGTRSGDGRLQRGRPGVVFLALHSGAPLLPVAHSGTEFFWRNLGRLRRTPIRLVVGQPFYLGSVGARVDHQVRQQMTDEVMYQLAALMPSENRGAYSDLGRATEASLRFSGGSVSNLRPAIAHSLEPSGDRAR